MEDLKKHNYEIMYFVDDQNQKVSQSIEEKLYEILTRDGGKIIKEKKITRDFAYPINKKVKGNYLNVNVLTSSKNIERFKNIFLSKQKDIKSMRLLVINLDNEKINKFKPKHQVETSSFSRSAKIGNRPFYNREENIERKPRPIAGTETSYRTKTNYQNTKTINSPSTDQKD